MKIAFVADVHIANFRRMGGGRPSAGINDRCRLVLEALEVAVQTATSREAEAFIILGDLFDVLPTPQILTQTQSILEGAPNPIIIAGNHDLVSEVPGDYALGPLHPVADVIDRPGIYYGDGFLLDAVPYQSTPAKERIRFSAEKGAIGCLHVGVSDSDTPAWLVGTSNSIPVEDLFDRMRIAGIRAVATGDWHERRHWVEEDMSILQVGTLAPTGFDNPGLVDYGFMGIWDDEEGAFESIPIPGPRFLKVTSEEDLELAIGELRSHHPKCRAFVEFETVPEEVKGAIELISEAKERGDIVDGQVILDGAEAKKVAERAAGAARSAKTLEEALAVYVREKVSLPGGLDPEEVLRISRECLARGDG